MIELNRRIQRFCEIGKEIAILSEESKQLRKEIAILSEESKQLRKEIAEDTNRLKLGMIQVNEKEPVEFLIKNSLISVKQSGEDFTILCKDLKQCEIVYRGV